MGTIGQTSFEAPSGVINCELLLKRQFEIENSELINVFDTDIVSQDAYLQRALSGMSSERLQDIVTTIQAEQYEVIRKPLRVNLIVQGAAGSGKTTIALHRIAYLLYAFADRLKSERMLILAPNPLFLNYISGVLPDLGVENTIQTTYAEFMRGVLGFLPRSIKTGTNGVCAFKGSLEMLRLLERFLDIHERSFIPEDGISFGPVNLYTKQEFEKFIFSDEAGFPMEYRLNVFSKQLKGRVNAATKKLNAWFEKECERRTEALKQRIHDKAELKAKLDALSESLAARIGETNAYAAGFSDQFMKSLPTTSPIEVYRLFWEWIARESHESAALSCSEYALRQKKPETQDIAALGLIALRMISVKKPPMRHAVIDEAQDLSPLQFVLLRRILPDASFTIVGDLMQGISVTGGTADWDEISQTVFGGKCERCELTTSYRSTRQIMEEAFKISR